MKTNKLFDSVRQYASFLMVILAAAIAVSAYLPALHYPFISDDLTYIPDNKKLFDLRWFELWHLFVEPYNSMAEFLPLRELSYWFDMTLFGLNPTAFRLHNIILYLLCLPLVYATTLGLWRYFRPSDKLSAPWAAAAVTALFALHPAFVESVVWISGRKYVLANLFAMLALWFAVNARREYGLAVPHAVATLIAFAAMMLSKSSYVALAPIIAMLWWLFWLDIPKPDRHRYWLLWPAALLLLATSLLRVFIASSTDKSELYLGVETIVRPLAILGWLTRLAFSPESRHYFYPVFDYQYHYGMVALGAIVLAAAVVGSVMLLRKRTLEGFTIVAFLLMCMPYLQLIPFVSPSMVQDRYLALAAWPAMLLLVALAWRLNTYSRIALLLVFALMFGFQTVQRPRDWRNFEKLVDADLRAFPGYYMPASFKIFPYQLSQGLAREAYKTADKVSDPEFRKALQEMVRVYQVVHVDAVATGNPQIAINLLQQLFRDLQQKPEQAKWNSPVNRFWEKRHIALEGEWRFLAQSFPEDTWVRYSAGQWMLDDGRFKNAVLYLRAAIDSQQLPIDVRGVAYKKLGLALVGVGNMTEAEQSLLAALEQSPPDYQAYCSLPEVYKQMGMVNEAAQAGKNCSKFSSK